MFRFFLFPLAFISRLTDGPAPSGGWSSAYAFISPRFNVDTPFGPVSVVGLTLRQRLALWSFVIDICLEQCSSWHWFWVAYQTTFSSLPTVLFRGWKSSVFSR